MVSQPDSVASQTRLTAADGSPETRWSELDVRSLALFRVVLGLFVLLTVLSLSGDVAAFFTDSGILPRDVLAQSAFANEWLCFHMGAGDVWTQSLLNVALACFAIGLILGWHTPWMALGCWTLLNSLQVRNPFVFDRGDLQLVLMLFWGFFLPLGARWSLDARSGRRPLGTPRGMAAAGLVSQLAIIYLFAALLKNGPFWLTRGDGLEHSLISPVFATPLSLWVANAAGSALPLLNYAVIAGELFVALLLLCPWFVPLTRGLAVVLMILFHGGVGLLFHLGLFPWLALSVAVALLPREVWDGWGSRLQAFLDRRIGRDAIEECCSLRSARLRSGVLAVCLLLAIASNLFHTRSGAESRWLRLLSGPARALRLSQHWELFAPIPPYYGWWELSEQSGDGAKRMLFQGPPSREAPGLASLPSHRWRMAMLASLYPEFEQVRPGLVRNLAARYGSRGEGTLDYRFLVRLPDARGQLMDPVSWLLYQGPTSGTGGKAQRSGGGPTP